MNLPNNELTDEFATMKLLETYIDYYCDITKICSLFKSLVLEPKKVRLLKELRWKT